MCDPAKIPETADEAIVESVEALQRAIHREVVDLPRIERREEKVRAKFLPQLQRALGLGV